MADSFWADADRHLVRYSGAGRFVPEIIERPDFTTADGALDWRRQLDFAHWTALGSPGVRPPES